MDIIEDTTSKYISNEMYNYFYRKALQMWRKGKDSDIVLEYASPIFV